MSNLARLRLPPAVVPDLISGAGARSAQRTGLTQIEGQGHTVDEDHRREALIHRHRSLIPGLLVKPFERPFAFVRLISPVGSWFSPRSADTAA
jgi:hypothetical protein